MGVLKGTVRGASFHTKEGIAIPSGETLTVAGVAINAETLAMDGLTATAAELNMLDACPSTVAFAIAAGGANVAEITITMKDAAGATLTGAPVVSAQLVTGSYGA